MEKFDFNYQISDWKQRKELVEKYIADNKILEQIEELIIENTVPDLFDKKTGEPIRYHQLRDSRLTELNRLMIRLYDYILYAYDKEIMKDQKIKEKQRQALEDNAQGIKSFIRPKRGRYYKEPKWAIIDNNIITYNQDKLNRFNNNLGVIIDEQIQVYEKLKDEVTTMNKDILDKHKIRKIDLISDICYDIKICQDCRDSLNRVYIAEGIRSNHDKLSDVAIVYNKKFIKTILTNWIDVIYEARKNPSHYIHSIYMDFDIALKKVKLTTIQKEVLYKILNGESITSKDSVSFDHVADKLLKILN